MEVRGLVGPHPLQTAKDRLNLHYGERISQYGEGCGASHNMIEESRDSELSVVFFYDVATVLISSHVTSYSTLTQQLIPLVLKADPPSYTTV